MESEIVKHNTQQLNSRWDRMMIMMIIFILSLLCNVYTLARFIRTNVLIKRTNFFVPSTLCPINIISFASIELNEIENIWSKLMRFRGLFSLSICPRVCVHKQLSNRKLIRWIDVLTWSIKNYDSCCRAVIEWRRELYFCLCFCLHKRQRKRSANMKLPAFEKT